MSASRVLPIDPRSPTRIAEHADPQIVHDAGGFVMATWQNVAVHAWTIEAAPVLVARFEELSGAFVRAHPEGVSGIHIIAKNAALPTKEVRDHFRRVSDRHSKQVASVCYIVEGSGFWASALQSFVTGLHWVTQRPFGMHICSDIAAAAQWVPAPHALRTRVKLLPSELEAAIRFVRQRAG